MEEALAITEEGQGRLDRARNRLDIRIAEIMEEMGEKPNIDKDIRVEEEQAEGEAQSCQEEIPREPEADDQRMGHIEKKSARKMLQCRVRM